MNPLMLRTEGSPASSEHPSKKAATMRQKRRATWDGKTPLPKVRWLTAGNDDKEPMDRGTLHASFSPRQE